MLSQLKSLFSGEGLKARALRSTLFTGLGFGSENVMRLISNLILTRLLFPEAFGLMALIQVVLAGLNMFSDLGLRAAIIQDKNSQDESFLNTAWTIQIIRGGVLFLAACLLAYPMAVFYEEPLLLPMMPVAGLSALFQGFNSTRMATANRDLVMGRLTAVTISNQIIGLIITVALAFYLRSVWALVIGGSIAALIRAVSSHLFLPGERNRLSFSFEHARRLIGFGKYIFLASMAGFLIQFGDRAILGKIVSLADLGLYNIAFFLASVPILLIGVLTDKVLFPLYRWSPPAESPENWAKIATARFLLTGSVIPIVAVLALSGHLIVGALYDTRYEDSGPLLILIALAQLPTMLIASYSIMALAAGESGRFALIVVSLAMLRTLMMLVLGSYFGMIGVIIGPAASSILFYPLLLWLIWKYRAWDYRHDLFYGGLMIALTALTIWLHDDLMLAAYNRFAG